MDITIRFGLQREAFFTFFMFFVIVFPGRVHGSSSLPSEGPDLVVGIVVDNMRFDYLTRMWDKFGDGGFRRLVSEGSSFTNARYEYLVNQSSSGYTTIFSGSDPSAHGIIADHWYDRIRNEIRSPVFDDRAVAVGGSYSNGKRSPSGLFGSTLGDEIRLANDFESRVFSVSMKDASAVLAGGFSANAAWWFDDINGGWMSSSFYIDSLPGWVAEFNSVMLPETYLDRRWEPFNEPGLFFGLSEAEDGRGFRYELSRMQRRSRDYGLLREVPFGNTFTKDFAISLIVNEELGVRGKTDMIIVGFSATDQIDSRYGTFSPEIQDAYLRLDSDIDHLLDFLDDRYGRSGVLVFLTSDRAVSYPASYNQTARITGGIFSPGMAMSLLRSYLNVSFGHGDWVSYYSAGMVYLNQNLIEDSNIQLGDIQGRASMFLNQFTGIAGSVTGDVLTRNYFNEGISAKIQAGFHPKRSGDIIIYLQQGWYERSIVDDQTMLVSYDQNVPLLFYGWDIGHKTINRPVSVADIAPTISTLLGIPRPPFATGEPIMELMR